VRDTLAKEKKRKKKKRKKTTSFLGRRRRRRYHNDAPAPPIGPFCPKYTHFLYIASHSLFFVLCIVSMRPFASHVYNHKATSLHAHIWPGARPAALRRQFSALLLQSLYTPCAV
jgi:hypothetical protein